MGRGQTFIQSFGIERVVVKDMGTTQGNGIYEQKRRRGGISESDGHSVMLGMIMGKFPADLHSVKINYRERRVSFYRNEHV